MVEEFSAGRESRRCSVACWKGGTARSCRDLRALVVFFLAEALHEWGVRAGKLRIVWEGAEGNESRVHTLAPPPPRLPWRIPLSGGGEQGKKNKSVAILPL